MQGQPELLSLGGKPRILSAKGLVLVVLLDCPRCGSHSDNKQQNDHE
jgi:hypothetical protein